MPGVPATSPMWPSLPGVDGRDGVLAGRAYGQDDRIDALVCRHTLAGATRPALQPGALNGMLKGFMDLVFEHQGRYYVADYKSNWLGPDDAAYTPAAMRAAILHARYELQYVLYLLALHRLLKARLPDYDYERHVGGAVYVFLRGVHAPSQGLHVERPPRALIEALDACLRVLPHAGSAMSHRPFDSPRAAMQALLACWAERQWLRPLDVAFADFLWREVPDAPPLLILAAALASHQLGRGHACLDLAATLQAPAFALSLPPEGRARGRPGQRLGATAAGGSASPD
jgi:hypothetical protein